MPTDSGHGGRGAGSKHPGELPQHPHVERLKAQPDQPARKTVVLVGLPGKSDRPGYQRLYLTSKLDFYAEFQVSDMVHAESVAADQSPIAGQEATRVTIARDTTIHYIWATTSQPIDEFDLDVRIGSPGAAMAAIGLPTHVATCFPDGSICLTCNGTCEGTCHPHVTCATCATCETRCNQNTCHTCETRCNQPTCPATCNTCFTHCNQPTCGPTCNTCQTQCNQPTCPATCHTCFTQCNQVTCHTCHTRCEQATCFTCATCDDTCHRTCATCVHPCPLPQ
jgi:hypothetical protein